MLTQNIMAQDFLCASLHPFYDRLAEGRHIEKEGRDNRDGEAKERRKDGGGRNGGGEEVFDSYCVFKV